MPEKNSEVLRIVYLEDDEGYRTSVKGMQLLFEDDTEPDKQIEVKAFALAEQVTAAMSEAKGKVLLLSDLNVVGTDPAIA